MACRALLRRLLPAARLPFISGSRGSTALPGGRLGSSSAVANFGQVRCFSSEPVIDVKYLDHDAFIILHFCIGLLTCNIIRMKVQTDWEKPGLEAELKDYDLKIEEAEDKLYDYE